MRRVGDPWREDVMTRLGDRPTWREDPMRRVGDPWREDLINETCRRSMEGRPNETCRR